MMLSVMVVGAGAAFSDQSKIKNTEAVDACTALNIIGGYPDGSFKPEGNITRAEVTKMICVALNGGKEPNLATNATPTFSDVRTNANSAWAEKYIESCYAQGIVSGVGAGKFAPAGNVTGTQLAKMLLVALGYKSENEGFTGNAWATNVNTVASAKGLYAGLETIDPSAAITRDNAAQMVWNALNANEVEYKTNLIAGPDGKLSTQITVQDKVVNSNNDKITLLEDKYDAIAVTGTLDDVSKNNGKTTYSITVNNAKYNSKKYNDGRVTYSDVAKDYSNLLYQNVRVLVKPEKNGQDAIVYGVYATSKNTTQSGLLKNLKLDGNKAKLDGTKYDLASESNQVVYVNGNILYKHTKDSKGSDAVSYSTSDTELHKNDVVTKATIKQFVGTYGDGADNKYTSTSYLQGSTVQLLAVDGTSNYSILKVVTYRVAKVTAIGSDYINVSYKGGDTNVGGTSAKLENDSWDYSSDLKKNDYVVLTDGDNYSSGNGKVEKATVVSGKVTGTRSNDSFAIDGSWYTIAGNADKGKLVKKQPSTGSKLEVVVVNGYVYFYDTLSGNVDDIALLVEAAPSGGTGSKWEARLIFADGTDKTVSIEKYWGDKDNKSYPIPKMKEWQGGILVSYETSGSTYTLTQIGAQSIDDNKLVANDYETAGYDYAATITTGKTAKTDSSIQGTDAITLKNSTGTTSTISRLYYESTGVVFVKYKGTPVNDAGAALTYNEKTNKWNTSDGQDAVLAGYSDADYKVVTGKAASDYERDLAGMMAVVDKNGNNYYAQSAFIDIAGESTSGSSDNYAVVLEDVEKDTASGSTLYQIKAWNGKENITIKTDNSAAKNLKMGNIFSYTGSVDNADIDTFSQNNYYVGAYDAGSGDVTLYSDKNSNAVGDGTKKYTKIDSKDTVVIYVNSNDHAGVASGEIDLAYWYDSDFTQADLAKGDQNANVRAYFNDSDYITVLVVDVNRDITEW